jgi:putative copper export protein
MLPPSLSTVRLFLHVMAASVWVGGQFALAGIVPTLRRAAPESTKAVANAFSRVAWPSFVVLVVTGVWNLMAVDVTHLSGDAVGTILAHLALGVLSGMFVAVHSYGSSRAALAVGGALGVLTAVGAVFLGILAHGTGLA